MKVLLGSVVLGGFCLYQLGLKYQPPFPPMTASLTGSQATLKDAGGVILGLRRLSADLAWIQTLQYYGTAENGQSEFEFENGLGQYPHFLDHCRHVVHLDPYFTYAYLFGAGVLGWNLNRLPEAEALLKEGMAHNPREWRFPQYLAGLAYQKNHNVSELLRFLESLAQDPECPLMMKQLLANLYKKQRLFDKAIAVWEIIYASGDPDYRRTAIKQVKEIQALRKRKS